MAQRKLTRLKGLRCHVAAAQIVYCESSGTGGIGLLLEVEILTFHQSEGDLAHQLAARLPDKRQDVPADEM